MITVAEPNAGLGSAETADEVGLRFVQCTVCTDPQAAEIDAALLGGMPLNQAAETFRPSRSAIHRHKTNHLSVQTITEPEPSEQREPLRMVDVHSQLAALADRLERVVELATRTRKAPAAVAAMRELRQTLEAIARIQADPELKRAASLQDLKSWIDEATGDAVVRLFDWVLGQFGSEFAFSDGRAGVESDRLRVVSRLMADGLRCMSDEGTTTRFASVDTSYVVAFREQEALSQARRLEAEVQRRVEAELKRREAQARPAIEAREVRAIEGGAAWTA